MRSITLLWEYKGKLKKHTLPPGAWYLGRPGKEHLKDHPDLNPLSVYILPYKPGEGKPIHTSDSGYTVSRLHVLLKITYDNMEIRDHGPSGKGATNPTLINGVAIPPGGRKSLPLDRCWTATLRLSSFGPLYTIIPEHCELPEGVIKLMLYPGTVQLLPPSLAKELRERGLVEEEARLGDAFLVVLRAPDPQAGSPNLVLQGEELPGVKIFPLGVRTVGEEHVVKDLQMLATYLRDLRVYLYREDWERVEELAHVVSLEHFSKIMRSLGSKAFREYEQLLYHLLERRSYSVSDLDKRLERLIAVLDEEVRRRAAGAP